MRLSLIHWIAWLSGDQDVMRAIDSRLDYCRHCAEQVAGEYRQQFPSFADHIQVKTASNSVSRFGPANCCKCGSKLASIVYFDDAHLAVRTEIERRFAARKSWG